MSDARQLDTLEKRIKTFAAIQFFESQGLPTPVAEYPFHPERRWRFDYAWPDQKIAIEVEGGIWTGGRHTSQGGFIGDMEKYTEAAVMGWCVIRITPKALMTLHSVGLVKRAIQRRA